MSTSTTPSTPEAQSTGFKSNSKDTSSTSSSSSKGEEPKNHCFDPNQSTSIKDVWQDNFEEEMWKVIKLIEKYKVVGMDTEFPGIIYRYEDNDMSHYQDYSKIKYTTIKMNVDRLKIIQIGLSLSDEQGYLPEGVSTWQFNFKFDQKEDHILDDALNMLRSAGINLDDHAKKGIDPELFAEYLISSGLILNEDVKWVCFHGGFDFGYLIKMIIGEKLPDDDLQFYNLLITYFPKFYDVKHMIKDLDTLKNAGLSKLATELQVKRIGTPHQGGSDSLLTLSSYFKLREFYLKNTPDNKFVNYLYGFKTTNEEFVNEAQWHNYFMNEYSMMYNNYRANGMHMMNNYYQSPESHYNANMSMPYNMGYPNFAGPNYGMDNMNSNKIKKFASSGSKIKTGY